MEINRALKYQCLFVSTAFAFRIITYAQTLDGNIALTVLLKQNITLSPYISSLSTFYVPQIYSLLL